MLKKKKTLIDYLYVFDYSNKNKILYKYNDKVDWTYIQFSDTKNITREEVQYNFHWLKKSAK